MIDELDTLPKRMIFFRQLRGLSLVSVAERLQVASRTMISYESEDRSLPADIVAACAEIYAAPVEALFEGRGIERFFISGSDIDPNAIAALRHALDREYTRIGNRQGKHCPAARRVKSQLDALKNGSLQKRLETLVNQEKERLEEEASQAAVVPYIPILETGNLRNSQWFEESTTFSSARTMPVSEKLIATARFVYEIPEHDLSMVAEGGVGFPPGTPLFIDPTAAIQPGKYVLADVAGFDELVFRRLVGCARPIKPGAAFVPFTLVALSPHFGDIKITDESQLRNIALVTGVHLPL